MRKEGKKGLEEEEKKEEEEEKEKKKKKEEGGRQNEGAEEKNILKKKSERRRKSRGKFSLDLHLLNHGKEFLICRPPSLTLTKLILNPTNLTDPTNPTDHNYM